MDRDLNIVQIDAISAGIGSNAEGLPNLDASRTAGGINGDCVGAGDGGPSGIIILEAERLGEGGVVGVEPGIGGVDVFTVVAGVDAYGPVGGNNTRMVRTQNVERPADFGLAW